MAVVQRRGREALAGTPGFYVNDPQSVFGASQRPGEYNASAPQTWTLMSIGRIAAGVWLGLWLFVFSAAIPAIIIFQSLEKARK
ncbi:MAG: hypothetical protein JJD93_14370 [Ilumatobacteraceae bacterium]|nr:hypothetical protein [Ilumatobacteraceae bacterium]